VSLTATLRVWTRRGDQLSLGTSGQRTFFGSDRPIDIAVAPGSPDRIAVSRGASSHWGSPFVQDFDDGHWLGGAYGDVEQITFGDDESTLYGWGDDRLQRMIVGTSGIDVIDTVDGLQSNRSGHMLHQDGILYAGDGSAVAAKDWS